MEFEAGADQSGSIHWNQYNWSVIQWWTFNGNDCCLMNSKKITHNLN